MKKIIIVLGFIICVWSGHAQNKPRNQVGVSLGWQNFRFLDKHSSPLMYGTNAVFPNLGLFYNKQTDNSIVEIQVSAINATINPARFGARDYKTRWSDKDSFQYRVASQFIHANITASYLRKINSLSDQKLNYWVGGTINEAAYYGDEVANTPWLLNTADLAPAIQLNYLPANKHSFTFRIDLSVLALITRPVYALFPKSSRDKNVPAYFKQGTRLASLDRFQKINFQFGYQYQVSNHFAAGAEYKLKWMHYSLPKDLYVSDKHFNVKLSYTY